MNCYEMVVPTTNSTQKNFKVGEVYHDCEDGIVYVFADDIGGAAAQVPVALKIRKIGRAFGYKRC